MGILSDVFHLDACWRSTEATCLWYIIPHQQNGSSITCHAEQTAHRQRTLKHPPPHSRPRRPEPSEMRPSESWDPNKINNSSTHLPHAEQNGEEKKIFVIEQIRIHWDRISLPHRPSWGRRWWSHRRARTPWVGSRPTRTSSRASGTQQPKRINKRVREETD